jgi:hypothetical protein
MTDQEISALPPPALPTTTSPAPAQIISSPPCEAGPPFASSPHTNLPPSPRSGRRLSLFNIFRRTSSKSKMQRSVSARSGGLSPTLNPTPAPTNPVSTSAERKNEPEPTSVSPRPRSRIRTPTQSPYASPRTSIYGALSSPSNSSNPGEIFERSIESVPSVTTQSPSVKAIPAHQVLEDIIPPALEATAATFTDHVDPDDVEIVTFSEIQSTTDSHSNAGSPVPSSPILTSPTTSAPPEAILNPWETDSTSPELDAKKRTLSLMSAVDHLADEIIHPSLPLSTDKKAFAPTPLSLSPAIAPQDRVTARRDSMHRLSMERSPSQASSVGDVVVMKQTMGEALRHQRMGHSVEGAHGGTSPIHSPPVKRDELATNPWNS